MMDPPATPTNTAAFTQHSPSSSSAASTAPSSPTTAGGFSDAQMKQLKELIQPCFQEILKELIQPLKDSFQDSFQDCFQEIQKVQKTQSSMQKTMSSMQKTLGLLVEEKARQMACRQCGEYFGRPFKIKSIYDLVKLIANANTIHLKKDDHHARTEKVNMLVEILEQLLPSFHKVAIMSVLKVVNEDSAFANTVFTPIKNELKNDVTDAMKLDIVDWERILGRTLGILSQLTEPKIDGENKDSEAVKERVRLLTSPFKRKLERLKVTASGDLTSCKSAGILLLSALADGGEEVWISTPEIKREWIEGNSKLFDFKEEIECDLTPTVSVVGRHATITVGEIKTSIERYKGAKKQMIYMAKLLHLGLWFVIGGPFESVVKKGHLYVIEAKEDDQRLRGELDQGISIFAYKAC